MKKLKLDDLDRLQEFLSGVISKKQNDMRRQTPMEFKERMNNNNIISK